jgi:hypothetical protein
MTGHGQSEPDSQAALLSQGQRWPIAAAPKVRAPANGHKVRIAGGRSGPYVRRRNSSRLDEYHNYLILKELTEVGAIGTALEFIRTATTGQDCSRGLKFT